MSNQDTDSQYGLGRKPLPPSRSSSTSYTFDFSIPISENVPYDYLYRSNRSERPQWSPKPSWSSNAPGALYEQHLSPTSRNLDAKGFSRVITHSYSSQFDGQLEDQVLSSSPQASSSSWWGSSSPAPSSASSPAISTTLSQPVKEEPDSPRIIIEPLVASALVTKRSSSSSPEPSSPPTQAELETQLLLSQSLAPPTEVPLRATQACDDMRKMMRSFRLNPFSILTGNGRPTNNESEPVLTWCGTIPGPLEQDPVICEWQLEGYNSGLEDELIVMDDLQGDSDLPADPKLGEDSESQRIFSTSLLISEAASNSDFSSPAEERTLRRTKSFTTLPRTLRAPVFGPRDVDLEQRAASCDSGYESASLPCQTIDSSNERFLHSDIHHHPLHGFPIYKKPRLLGQGLSLPNNFQQGYEALHSSYKTPCYGSNNSSRRMLRKPGSEETLNSSRQSSQVSARPSVSRNTLSGSTRRRSSSGSMYLPTLLNAEPERNPPSHSSNSFSLRPPARFKLGPSRNSPTLSNSLSSSPAVETLVPSTEDMRNVADIWATAANPRPEPPLREPGSVSQEASFSPFRQSNSSFRSSLSRCSVSIPQPGPFDSHATGTGTGAPIGSSAMRPVVLPRYNGIYAGRRHDQQQVQQSLLSSSPGIPHSHMRTFPMGFDGASPTGAQTGAYNEEGDSYVSGNRFYNVDYAMGAYTTLEGQ
ncbi:hypothetical protein BDP27DRAFT_1412648 [Rhodocollybia butyracea]|uniref:Uncharacterized protein n=1 Tax=Rhodocollybia butyracea TaxID=206335 RepID=A0A9P5QAX5_9AGAR|nr:hypothetical protein BDP27DRAFT_1412648 [Rhodocollybia butyracea]